MENVKCGSCGKPFTFDPKTIWNSPSSSKNAKPTANGIVLIPCPHCLSLRRFLLNPERPEPSRIGRPARQVQKLRSR